MLLPRKFSGTPKLNSALLPSYKTILIVHCPFFLGLTSPYLLLGEAQTPHKQHLDVGAIDIIIHNEGVNLQPEKIEDRKLNDYINSYTPEISAHFKDARSDWLTLWTSKNELGRPTYQISGFSPAPLSWIVAKLTDSPWQFITIFSLFACFFAGDFVILFYREISLSPIAGLIEGSSLAASPLFMYWLTFPMFPAVSCWSTGALWAVTRLARKPDLVGWSVVAFSTYSLLMTAYPQPVVFHAYILEGYGLYLAYRKLHDVVRFLALAATALITGAALAFPVSTESARVAPAPSFFTVVLPTFDTFTDALRFFVLCTTPELFGNPVGTSFALSYDGLSVMPLLVFFAVIALFVSYR